jgi:hypothetical protein
MQQQKSFHSLHQLLFCAVYRFNFIPYDQLLRYSKYIAPSPNTYFS